MGLGYLQHDLTNPYSCGAQINGRTTLHFSPDYDTSGTTGLHLWYNRFTHLVLQVYTGLHLWYYRFTLVYTSGTTGLHLCYYRFTLVYTSGTTGLHLWYYRFPYVNVPSQVYACVCVCFQLRKLTVEGCQYRSIHQELMKDLLRLSTSTYSQVRPHTHTYRQTHTHTHTHTPTHRSDHTHSHT